MDSSPPSWSDPVPCPPKVSVLSLRTGRVRPLGGPKVKSAINKQPCEGKVWLSKVGFIGDERSHPPHQGPDNAVHQYTSHHYDTWKIELPDHSEKFKIGAFGENISTRHLSEQNVCIGDKFRLGDAIIQVTMNRQPCFKLNHRFEHKKMASLVQDTGRTGWLYRVLQEGWVQEGDDMELLERLNPNWSLARLIYFLYTDRNNAAALSELVTLPGLSTEFSELFQNTLLQGAADMNGRLQGGADEKMIWHPYTLVSKSRVTSRVQKFVFEADDQDLDPADIQFPRFPHVRVKFGPSDKFTRAYSVVSGDMKRFELGVAKDDNSRGGSVYLHDEFAVGDKLQVAKGHAPARKDGAEQDAHKKKHVFILGGIGVTAFMNEIRDFARLCVDFEIHYAVRSREEAAFLGRLPEKQTMVYAKTDGQRLRVSDIIPSFVNTADPEVMIYCCGPPALIDAVRNRGKELGYTASSMHFEEFGGAAAGTGDPFEVEIKSTNKILAVPQEKSLLQVLNEAGFDVESSCLAGNCGTCMVDYCKGDVAHQGVALDDEQKETMMLSCVSRGKGRITLDF
ncbi:PK beta-barrel-protein domain-containing protein-like protein [Xylariaceae sp. FL1272]|nr:PK beta-barrel-protein domain-containing protein-like protein [Xylariaceae sp. FL1272]